MNIRNQQIRQGVKGPAIDNTVEIKGIIITRYCESDVKAENKIKYVINHFELVLLNTATN